MKRAIGILTVLSTISQATAADEVARGFITGVVTNVQGIPLKGVRITADDMHMYNSNLVTQTDANGRYKINVKNIATTWNVTARMILIYKEYSIPIELVPNNVQSVPGNVGGVRDFVLKPKEVSYGDPYGNLGRVNVQRPVGVYDIEESQLQLTLTPVGKLADGTTGKPLSVKPIQTGSGWMVPNVMWGTYKVTATQSGQPLQVRKKASATEIPEWGNSYTGDFVMAYSATVPTLFIEVRHPPQ
ncbi:carboxypeptidase-like regulatory domain-containing protein [Deinococcus hopiensis]|uniref:Carboxypeptidase regulatory-like domain-containing protein n=1 Tax=Deinococcus hopiensis KR-140 TaxID=695939 RepID=A0A1W1VUN4_9DEIO|nr:carboxypeptidase-like regulatory domain-containing protein [Deinococcus hopiensis]SMB96930.1 hypothetical protein SAMN00790413_06217 [Deinococcus hopiensis KR-140]